MSGQLPHVYVDRIRVPSALAGGRRHSQARRAIRPRTAGLRQAPMKSRTVVTENHAGHPNLFGAGTDLVLRGCALRPHPGVQIDPWSEPNQVSSPHPAPKHRWGHPNGQQRLPGGGLGWQGNRSRSSHGEEPETPRAGCTQGVADLWITSLCLRGEPSKQVVDRQCVRPWSADFSCRGVGAGREWR